MWRKIDLEINVLYNISIIFETAAVNIIRLQTVRLKERILDRKKGKKDRQIDRN